MTVPHAVQAATERVSDFVRGLIPQWRNRLTREEMALAAHLRGNQALYDALCDVVRARLGGRQMSPVPSDPVMCLALMSRDSELRWVLHTLERAFNSTPAHPDHEDGEQPA